MFSKTKINKNNNKKKKNNREVKWIYFFHLRLLVEWVRLTAKHSFWNSTNTTYLDAYIRKIYEWYFANWIESNVLPFLTRNSRRNSISNEPQYIEYILLLFFCRMDRMEIGTSAQQRLKLNCAPQFTIYRVWTNWMYIRCRYCSIRVLLYNPHEINESSHEHKIQYLR